MSLWLTCNKCALHKVDKCTLIISGWTWRHCDEAGPNGSPSGGLQVPRKGSLWDDLCPLGQAQFRDVNLHMLKKDPATSRSEGGERWKGENFTFQNILFSWTEARQRSKVMFKTEEEWCQKKGFRLCEIESPGVLSDLLRDCWSYQCQAHVDPVLPASRAGKEVQWGPGLGQEGPWIRPELCRGGQQH